MSSEPCPAWPWCDRGWASPTSAPCARALSQPCKNCAVLKSAAWSERKPWFQEESCPLCITSAHTRAGFPAGVPCTAQHLTLGGTSPTPANACSVSGTPAVTRGDRIRAWTSLWHLNAVKMPVLQIPPNKKVECKAMMGAKLIATSSKCSVRAMKKKKRESVIQWMLISMQWKDTMRGAHYRQEFTNHSHILPLRLCKWICFPRTPWELLWRWAGIWKGRTRCG